MAFHPFEVNAPHLVYAFLGGFIVIVSPTLFFFSCSHVVFVLSSTPRCTLSPDLLFSSSHPLNRNLSISLPPSSFRTPLVLRLDDLSVCRLVGSWRNSGTSMCLLGMSGKVILHRRPPIAIASTIQRSFFASEQASRSKQT
jgi:hypothetical protein